MEAAAEELAFEVPTRRKTKTANAAEDLRGKVRKAEREHESIRDQERSLAELRQRRAEAQEAAKRAVALDEAIKVAEARSEDEAAEVELKGFPAVMAQVRGDEVKTLERLRDTISDAEDDIESAEEDINEAEIALRKSAIPEGGLPEGRLAEIRVRVSELGEAGREVRNLEADLAKAGEQEESAWKRLSAGVDKEEAVAIELPDVQRMETHVEGVEELQGRREALSTLENLLEAEAPEESAETLWDGLRVLVRWLQESKRASGEYAALWPTVIMGGAALVAGAGAAAIATASGIMWWLGAALVVLAALLAVAGWKVRTSQGASSSMGSAARKKEFERTGLEAPSAWTGEGVERHVDYLLGRLREAEVSAEKRAEWERNEPELEELEEKKEALAKERERLAEAIGFDPGLSSRSLSWLLDRLSQWQSAYDDVQGLENALSAAEGNAEKLVDALNSLLAPYELDGIEDGADAKGSLAALESEHDDYREAMGKRGNAEDKKRRAERDLQRPRRRGRRSMIDLTSAWEKRTSSERWWGEKRPTTKQWSANGRQRRCWRPSYRAYEAWKGTKSGWTRRAAGSWNVRWMRRALRLLTRRNTSTRSNPSKTISRRPSKAARWSSAAPNTGPNGMNSRGTASAITRRPREQRWPTLSKRRHKTRAFPPSMNTRETYSPTLRKADTSLSSTAVALRFTLSTR